jgi:A/G-specific adenine glycosylase
MFDARCSSASSVSLSSHSKEFRTALVRWFRRHGRDLPWRRTRDPYAVMVSELMLQQTQVATVLPFYARWLARFPTFTALAAAEEGAVLAVWQGLGYYARARHLHRAARQVVERHGGALPADLQAIRALPGAGRYTAGAIASFAFDLPAAIVDGNIARVLSRLLDLREPIDSARGSARLWATAEALVPRRGARVFNSALMELGALLCTPRQPQCLLCPVRAHCAAENPEALPVKKARRATVAIDEDCAWVVKDGRVLLEQQTGSRWRGLWKLPALPARPRDGEPLLTLEYPFTHHRVTLRVFAARTPRKLGLQQRWWKLAGLEQVALAAPHRRAVARVGAESFRSSQGLSPRASHKTGPPWRCPQ